MQPIQQFTLERSADAASKLMDEQKPTRLLVPGLVVEDQYLLPSGHCLLITSDDSPYEECLHLLLINPDRTDYERIDIGAAYTPGIYQNPAVGDEGLTFSFFDDYRYQVKICMPARRALHTLLGKDAISYIAPLRKKTLFVDRIR